MPDALSGDTQQFNNKVANSLVVREIIEDLNGLKDGQKNLAAKVDKLTLGSDEILKEIKSLTTALNDKKTQDLRASNDSLREELKRRRTNADKLKNGVITGLVLLFATVLVDLFVTNKFLNKSNDSNDSLEQIEKAVKG